MKNEKKNNNIINFPNSLTNGEREVEAILFAASEPLEIESIEARCTILNRFLKEISKKQYSSKNLVKIANSIYEKNKGQVSLQEFLKIVWDKNYINFEHN